MNKTPDDKIAATEQKIAALKEQVRQTERDLQELTGLQSKSNALAESGPILLLESQEKPRAQEAAKMQTAILNALRAHIALLDSNGVILAVNEAWLRFASSRARRSRRVMSLNDWTR